MALFRDRTRLILLGLVVLTAVLSQLPLPQPIPQILAILLIAVWPTIAWQSSFTGSFFERLLTAAGALLLINGLVFFLLMRFGVRTPIIAASVLAFVAISPLIRYDFKLEQPFIPVLAGQRPSLNTSVILGLMVTTAVFRFVNLGYSEFQGDESIVMQRAAAILLGDTNEFFLHQKGPMEILLPLGLWQLAGELTEFWARLPFAWASFLIVGAIYVLAKKWFGPRVGLLAALLLAIVGFAVAFGRIVQYQSLVMLWTTLALIQLTDYRENGRSNHLFLASLFLAGGLLAHYDAVLIVPAAVWLVGQRLYRTKVMPWRGLIGATVLGGVLLGSFYLPFFTNPNFGRTGQYLLQGRLGGGADGSGLLSWSGTAVWQMATFYNSTYFIFGLILLLLSGLSLLMRRQRGMVAVLHFFAPLLFYLFIVADPRTHVYTFFPGGVILAAYGAVAIYEGFQSRKQVLATLFSLFWLISAAYVYLLFIDHTPERQRTWAENRPFGYVATWESPPLFGLFGFPHQAGWRAAAPLITDFPYASNEEEEITNWYMAQAPRTHCGNFETFVLAEDVQDEIPYDPAWLEGMQLQNEVSVNGRSSLKIYTRQETAVSPMVEARRTQRWLTPRMVAPPVYFGTNPLNVVLGEQQVALRGYDLDARAAHPGGQVTVTLYWLVLVPFAENYQVFTHLVDDSQQPVAQHDGAPECNINPTTRWEPGQIVPDPHIIPLSADMAANTYELTVGMYNLITLERLQVQNPSVAQAVDKIRLLSVRVE